MSSTKTENTIKLPLVLFEPNIYKHEMDMNAVRQFLRGNKNKYECTFAAVSFFEQLFFRYPEVETFKSSIIITVHSQAKL